MIKRLVRVSLSYRIIIANLFPSFPTFFSFTPSHPSLHFKKVNKYWSVRIGKAYRALGIEVKNGILWFWIGTHYEYDRLISK
jgi:hypothetical protein